MVDNFRFEFREDSFHEYAVFDVAIVKVDMGIKIFSKAARQIIEYRNIVSEAEVCVGNMRADESGSARNQNSHEVSNRSSWASLLVPINA
jgi:hypothetical protein